MDNSGTPSGNSADGEHGTSPEAQLRNVADRFQRGRNIFVTRSSEGWEGMDRESGRPCVVWMLRFPLNTNSDAAERFCARIQHISQLLPETNIITYGVDAQGYAYAATEPLPSRNVISEGRSVEEAERIFVQVVEITAGIHSAGLVLGDISDDSFVLDESGKVRLVGFLGSFEAVARQTAMLPPRATFQYLAPEQRSGAAPDPRTDVFALGILGYRLLTGKPASDKTVNEKSEDPVTSLPAPTLVRFDLPSWVDDVLGRALEQHGPSRYQDAGELRDVIRQAQQTGVGPGGSGRWSRRTVIVRPQQAGPKKRELATYEPQSRWTPPVEEEETDRKGLPFVMSAIVALFSGLLIIGIVALFRHSPDKGQEEEQTVEIVQINPDALSPAMKDLYAQLNNTAGSFESKREALTKIAETSDVQAQDILLSVVGGGSGEQLVRAGEQAIIDRLKRQSQLRPAEVLQRWLKSVERTSEAPGRRPVFRHLLQAIDAGASLDQRRTALNKAFSYDPAVSYQLAAALALDDSDPERFAPIVRQMLASDLGAETVETKSIDSLVFANRSLSNLFGGDLLAKLDKLSDNELLWTFSQAGTFDSSYLIDLCKEILRRKLNTSYQDVFLRTLSTVDLYSISRGVQLALVHGSIGKVEPDDVDAIGRWTVPESERLLLAYCASSKNPQVRVDAFDIMAARSLQNEPTASLVHWIKSRDWEHREPIVKSICVLGLAELATDEDLTGAFSQLSPLIGAGPLFRMLVSVDNPRLVSVVIDKMGPSVPGDDILPLLSHENREVRIKAIRALAGRNELTVLQEIYRAYENEKDEEVRKVYQEVHWVTRRDTKQ